MLPKNTDNQITPTQHADDHAPAGAGRFAFGTPLTITVTYPNDIDRKSESWRAYYMRQSRRACPQCRLTALMIIQWMAVPVERCPVRVSAFCPVCGTWHEYCAQD